MKGLIVLPALVAIGYWMPLVTAVAGATLVAAIFIIPISRNIAGHLS